MKNAIFLLLTLAACTSEPKREHDPGTTTGTTDTAQADTTATSSAVETPAADQPATYANARFRSVKAERIGEHQFRITGQAQVFEASISWVIEDGHNELKKGHEMTDAGAPEWGRFSFVVEAEKERGNSTLHLILFEISAEDGSRQHELPVLLY